MDLGYIKLFRKSFESRVFKNDGLWKLWTWCLMKANHEEKWVTINTGRGTSEIQVGPGQFVFGRNTAAKELNMNPSTVWKRIVKLKNMQNLNIESNTHCSVVTITNWTFYQGNGKKGTGKVTGKEQASNTNKNDKKKEKEIYKEKQKFKDYVFFTEIEYQRLISDFGKKVIESEIEDLDNYIGTDPGKRIKKYKDHNRVIRTWLKKRGIKKTLKDISCPDCKTKLTPGDLKGGKCPVCNKLLNQGTGT